MKLPLRRTNLHRDAPFSFTCQRCRECCRHKKIQVNPYEVMRLAVNRRLSTAEFIERYTRNSGTVLDWKDDGTCVFLNEQGCGVHPDRPLVCRLYPLGRHIFATGKESFSEIEPDKHCKGVYAEDGLIASHIESQGALPFMEAADRYLDLLSRLCLMLEDEAADPEKHSAVVFVLRKSVEEGGLGDIGFADVDAIVEAFCEKMRLSPPQSINDKISIHIQAVEAWANSTRRRENHEGKKAKNIAGRSSGKKTNPKSD